MSANSHNVLFLLGSAREGGNAQFLAQRMAAALPASASHRTLHLDDYPLPAFRDIRHSVGLYPPPQGNEWCLPKRPWTPPT